MDITEVIRNYSAEVEVAKTEEEKKAALDKANNSLRELGSNVYIDPLKNVITDEEKAATTLSYDLKEINGYGMLDMGLGVPDKVKIEHSKLVGGGVGAAKAFVIIGNLRFNVDNDTITTLDGINQIEI